MIFVTFCSCSISCTFGSDSRGWNELGCRKSYREPCRIRRSLTQCGKHSFSLGPNVYKKKKQIFEKFENSKITFFPFSPSNHSSYIERSISRGTAPLSLEMAPGNTTTRQVWIPRNPCVKYLEAWQVRE